MIRGKEKFLVRWKGYTAEEDTWENRENLGNAKELVEDFEREYRKEVEELRWQEQEEEEKEFMNYLGNSQQEYYMVGEERGTKKKGKRDRTKIGFNGKIPRDEKT